jgi:hypothetical protein
MSERPQSNGFETRLTKGAFGCIIESEPAHRRGTTQLREKPWCDPREGRRLSISQHTRQKLRVYHVYSKGAGKGSSPENRRRRENIAGEERQHGF